MEQLIFLLLSFLLLTGCVVTGNNYVRGSGVPARESRPVDGAFTRIALQSSGDVTVVQAEPAAIEIEADDNILRHLTSAIRNGTLTLGIESGYDLQARTPIRYTITLPEIEGLKVAGSIKGGESWKRSICSS